MRELKNGEMFDIVQEIRLAKDREEQLGITADLHTLPRWYIRKLVVDFSEGLKTTEKVLPYSADDMKRAYEYSAGINNNGKKIPCGNIRNYVGTMKSIPHKHMQVLLTDYKQMIKNASDEPQNASESISTQEVVNVSGKPQSSLAKEINAIVAEHLRKRLEDITKVIKDTTQDIIDREEIISELRTFVEEKKNERKELEVELERWI